MFEGFTEGLEAFLAALRFNNNMAFFHENHDWYERDVREPLKALAGDLGPAVELFDPRLERRPARVISRIARDMRYAHGKGPYRDVMWISFRRGDVENRDGLPGLYFEISPEGASYGMGTYLENRPLMNGLRRELRRDSGPFLEALSAAEGFLRGGAAFRRMAVPEGLPDAARAWYPTRSYWLERPLTAEITRSRALVSEMERGFERLKPLYDYMTGIEPEDEDDA